LNYTGRKLDLRNKKNSIVCHTHKIAASSRTNSGLNFQDEFDIIVEMRLSGVAG